MDKAVEITHLQIIGGGLMVLCMPTIAQVIWVGGLALAYFLTRGDDEWRERW